MSKLTKILSNIGNFIGPEVKVDHRRKYVIINEGSIFGTEITEGYYLSRGYKVRVKQF